MVLPIDLFLVRHGESEGNIANREAKLGNVEYLEAANAYTSRLWRLTPLGQDQAAAAGGWLQRWMADQHVPAFDRHYCSPYRRTMQTAATLGLPGASWWLEPLLRERDRGYEQIRTSEEMRELHPKSTAAKKLDRFLWRPEGGESIPDVDVRMREVMGTLHRDLEPESRVICVTHEDAIWALRFRLEKMTIAEWVEADDDEARMLPNCGIVHYTRRDPETGAVGEKACHVTVTDPADGRVIESSPVTRRRFTNQELHQLAETDL